MDYILINSLQVDYVQDRHVSPALKDISLSLPQGKIGAIIGPSGCGKSTLLNVLAGLNKNYKGHVLLHGKPPQESHETALILQEYGLLPWKTVGDNVRLGLQIKGGTSKENTKKVEEIISRLELQDLKNRFPIQLSGGQRQRVAIARSLILQPELLLMDEPFSSLDALTREEMQDLLLDIWKETNLTILIITHNIEEAVFLGQKIFVMSASPGIIIQEIENPLAGDYSARGKVEFLEMSNRLRLSLRGGTAFALKRVSL